MWLDYQAPELILSQEKLKRFNQLQLVMFRRKNNLYRNSCEQFLSLTVNIKFKVIDKTKLSRIKETHKYDLTSQLMSTGWSITSRHQVYSSCRTSNNIMHLQHHMPSMTKVTSKPMTIKASI